MAEIHRRHGAVSYAVALTITQDGGRAEHAVIAAFVRLRDHAAVRRRPRSLRIEVLDATRRSAGSLAPGRMPKRWGRRRRPGDAYRSLSPDVRDVVALAVAGRCRCIEIASVMRTDHSTVRRDLSSGLRDAAAFLDTIGAGTRRAAGVPVGVES